MGMETQVNQNPSQNPDTEEIQLIEAILYLENEPVEIDRLMRISSLPRKKVKACLEQISVRYEQDTLHGMRLTEFAGGYHFVPKDELWEQLKSHYGRKIDRRLSRAALETLSIIAYSQPITKKEIENIRGVSSDNSLRLLLDREYIKVVGKKDVVGHPNLYGTTKKFLQDFNLKSISSLPKLHDVDYERFEEE